LKKPDKRKTKDKNKGVTTAKNISRKNQKVNFPIVGIGASAGGLEAIELFLQNVPEKSNMAFVIVQHLDPTHKGIMVELVQRSTSMKVMQVKDRTQIQANCVYIIPPNKNMSILHGILHLLDMLSPRGFRLPIDFFFRSLADDQQENSIGVILSGMGSDGTLGLRAIKEHAGTVFVQEPSNAKFDGMPRSAIDAGLADVIAKVEELPSKIIAINRHTPRITKLNLSGEGKTSSSLDKILILLRSQTRHDFSLYKKSTVYRRVERRMSIHQIDKIATYVHLLQENPNELEFLFKELLIGVTSFFRDPEMWEDLKNKVIIPIIKKNKQNSMLRAWIPGCSTGEEAYSLAVIFREAIKKLKAASNTTLQIFATDLDHDAIIKAREGLFPPNIAADVSPERLSGFFVEKENGYQIINSVRDMVIFAQQNIIMDPPFTKLDILCCRNLLIYFTTELQKKLIPLFHYALNPDGILVLGNAETIGSFSALFKPVKSKSKIYERLNSGILTEPVIFPSAYTPASTAVAQNQKPSKPVTNIQTLADQVLLQQFSPAAALVNEKGDIFYIAGRTGKYLEPAAGKVNWNIFAMARPGLKYELSNAFQNVLRKKVAAKIKNISFGTKDETQVIDLTIQPINEPEVLKGMVMITFTDVTPEYPQVKSKVKKHHSGASGSRVKELEQELEKARYDVQAINEEMQTSQEELKSTNEELQSTNEEIQSTNEELTTSKEEMQSMNEELQTVNKELQAHVDELSRTNNDMKNLLDSTDIATLFLDNSLNVRRFTNRTTEITKLIQSDVGRPITDIASELIYPEIEADVKKVLRTLISLEKEIPASGGQWYLVRILPYRTLENTIDGVVITYTDITVMKNLESELRKTQSELETRFKKQSKELDKTKNDLRIEKLR